MTDGARHPRIALYPGSFDLLSNGHLDLIRRASDIFDKLVVAVGVNPHKETLFSVEERLEILREATADLENVEVATIEGLTVDFAAKVGANVIIRGLRAVSDFEYELQLAITNRQINQKVETVFMAAGPGVIFLSSSMIKDVWDLGGDVSKFVPESVLPHLDRKRGQRRSGSPLTAT